MIGFDRARAAIRAALLGARAAIRPALLSAHAAALAAAICFTGNASAKSLNTEAGHIISDRGAQPANNPEKESPRTFRNTKHTGRAADWRLHHVDEAGRVANDAQTRNIRAYEKFIKSAPSRPAKEKAAGIAPERANGRRARSAPAYSAPTTAARRGNTCRPPTPPTTIIGAMCRGWLRIRRNPASSSPARGAASTGPSTAARRGRVCTA